MDPKKDEPRKRIGPRTDYDPDIPGSPGWDTAYNCYSFAMHAGLGDPTDPGNASVPPRWDDSPVDDLAFFQPLHPDAPNQPGDLVLYGDDVILDGVLIGREILHAGKVTSVDALGNTTRVESKSGAGYLFSHHPRDAHPNYGATRNYYRPIGTPE